MILTNKIGFDTKKYLAAQKKAIEDRLAKFSDKLYLEFGGKLLDDFHASRTLPGYYPNTKALLLKDLGKNLEILYCVSAKQLEQGKIRGDWDMGYDLATIKTLQDLADFGLPVLGVVINRFAGEEKAKALEKRLKRMGIKVFKRYEIEEYPERVEKILSDQGYGRDDYIEVKKSLVVVWGTGGGSGKLSTCLGQLYQDTKRGFNSGYAKFETFPVWNLPVNHPINVSYEASTADLGDFNLIDFFHLQAYKKEAVNYNRDIEAFPIIKAIFSKVLNKKNFSNQYQSPTDMGFNVLKEGIVDEKIVCEAAKKEVVFYLFRYRQEYQKGLTDIKTLKRIDSLLEKLAINEEYLKTVPAARRAEKKAKKKPGKGENGVYCGAAIELPNGQTVTGKNSLLLHAETAAILNAIKVLADIPDDLDLISKPIIRQISRFKKQIGEKSPSLNCFEAILALNVSAQTNTLAKKAQDFLPGLRGCFMHTTHELSLSDKDIFKKLGIWVSTDNKTAKIRND
ncbi:MAG: DUF1846 family protein [Candidatus Shapirobacteria bacterium]|nr:DUF1846 family protein [Candidatus Shapirobacteria bacterium]